MRSSEKHEKQLIDLTRFPCVHVSNGLIICMTTTFNDARWLAQRSVPKLVIESIMSDETSHQVKVPGGSPAWLLMVQAKMKAGNKHKCLMAPTEMAALDDDKENDSQAGNAVSDESGEDVSDESDDGSQSSDDVSEAQSKKRRRTGVRTRPVTQSQTWPVCVIRRSLSWLTISGNLMYTQLITPPAAMRQKGAEYLWSV